MAPEYAFKPGIKQPPIILYLLHGQGAQQFLRDFNQVIDDRYNGNKCLKRLELRAINDGDILGIRDRFYVDLGIALDFSGKNHEMAVDLFNQLPSDERTLDRVPCMLVGYGLKNFDEGQYKLNFEVTEDTTVRHASILAGQDGNFKNENVSLEDGLPCKSEEGSRRLCTTRQQEPSLDNLGISGVYLDWDLGLYSYGYDLGNSLEDGRVVVVA